MRSLLVFLFIGNLAIMAGCLGKSETKTIPGKNPPSQPSAVDGPSSSKLPNSASDSKQTPTVVNSTDSITDNSPQGVLIKENSAELNPGNTRIMFVGTHVGEKPDPRTCGFAEFTGLVKFESTQPTSITVEMKADSIFSFSPDLTNHLKSGDFLDAREYPTLKFESTKIELGADGKGTVTGNLTLLKVTKEISIPIESKVSEGQFTMTGETKIDRSEFGMSKMTERVSKDVTFSFAIGQKTDPTSVLAK